MESARPTVFTSSNKEGEERVMRGKGSYAYLMESTTIEYVIERNCDLTQVGGMLDSKGYGIAMPPSESACRYGHLTMSVYYTGSPQLVRRASPLEWLKFINVTILFRISCNYSEK